MDVKEPIAATSSALRISFPSVDGMKRAVQAFWDDAACGEVYVEGETLGDHFESHARMRYSLEPAIDEFARFDTGAGRDVLEVGIGMGADHAEWAKRRPARLVGVDITPRAIDWTRQCFTFYGFRPIVLVADAEELPFRNSGFDLVYSWGVLHHSPNTAAGVDEVYRVLRPGGTARVMIYHSKSVVGAILWTRFALLAGKPRRSLADVYAHHLESPGTQAFTVDEAEAMFRRFSAIRIRTELSIGDLLEGAVGQRHQGLALRAAKRLWPRALLRRAVPGYGLFMLIEATK
jgi:ubiquinone/menaquinone biosynthesis C-methylase UbiE